MFAVLPDVDAALIDFLDNHAALVPLHGGRVGTKLQSAETSIRIANLGGVQPWPWEGITEFQVECWGGTQHQAHTLARTVVAAIYDMRGYGGYVTSANVTLRPLWQPDDNGRPRYLVQIELRVEAS